MTYLFFLVAIYATFFLFRSKDEPQFYWQNDRFPRKKAILVSVLLNVVLLSVIFYFTKNAEQNVFFHKIFIGIAICYFIITILYVLGYKQELGGNARYSEHPYAIDFFNVLPYYTWIYYRGIHSLRYQPNFRLDWKLMILLTPFQFYGLYYFINFEILLIQSSCNDYQLLIALIISFFSSIILVIFFKYLIDWYARYAIDNHTVHGSKTSTTHERRGHKSASIVTNSEVYDNTHGQGAWEKAIYSELAVIRFVFLVIAWLLPLFVLYYWRFFYFSNEAPYELKHILGIALNSLFSSLLTYYLLKKIKNNYEEE